MIFQANQTALQALKLGKLEKKKSQMKKKKSVFAHNLTTAERWKLLTDRSWR